MVFINATRSVKFFPASLMMKEASVEGLLIWLAPDKDLAQAIAAVTAGSSKNGWVSGIYEYFII